MLQLYSLNGLLSMFELWREIEILSKSEKSDSVVTSRNENWFWLLSVSLAITHRYPFGDISPEACIQGPSRRDRNYAYWAYRVLLAGVEDDVSDIKDYYGYDNLTTLEGGVKSLNVKNFAAQQCNVEGVGHVGKKMWQSVSRKEDSHDTSSFYETDATSSYLSSFSSELWHVSFAWLENERRDTSSSTWTYTNLLSPMSPWLFSFVQSFLCSFHLSSHISFQWLVSWLCNF